MCERVNRVEGQPESSMADVQVDGERAMDRMDASRNFQRHSIRENSEVVTRRETRIVVVQEVRPESENEIFCYRRSE